MRSRIEPPSSLLKVRQILARCRRVRGQFNDGGLPVRINAVARDVVRMLRNAVLMSSPATRQSSNGPSYHLILQVRKNRTPLLQVDVSQSFITIGQWSFPTPPELWSHLDVLTTSGKAKREEAIARRGTLEPRRPSREQPVIRSSRW